jgi:hypothetical protein
MTEAIPFQRRKEQALESARQGVKTKLAAMTQKECEFEIHLETIKMQSNGNGHLSRDGLYAATLKPIEEAMQTVTAENKNLLSLWKTVAQPQGSLLIRAGCEAAMEVLGGYEEELRQYNESGGGISRKYMKPPSPEDFLRTEAFRREMRDLLDPPSEKKER